MAEEIRKPFKSMVHKNYENAVMNLLTQECQFLGGPKVLELIVHSISEITEEHFVPKEYVKSGDMLWTAVTADMKNA